MDRPPEPGDRRRTLDRPPGERYRSQDEVETAPRARSTARAVALGALVALAGSAAIVLLGGVFSLSAGLLVVAGAIGWVIARVVTSLAGPSAGTTLRSVIAVALAIDAVVLGQIGLWLHSLTQGGALGLVDYLVQARGLLIPAELLVACIVAWWTAR